MSAQPKTSVGTDPAPAAADQRRKVTGLFFQAVGFQAEGDHAQACEATQALLALEPDHVGALRILCTALLDARRGDEAWPFIDRLLGLAPLDPAAVLLRVRALRESGRLAEAVEVMLSMLSLSPGVAAVHAEMGVLMVESRRPREALAYFDRAIELDATDPTSHMNRALVRQELDLVEDALAGYDTALALNADHPVATLNRGTVLHYLRRFEEAVAAFERTQTLCLPNSVEWITAGYNKGTSLLQQGRYDAAWPLLENRWGIKGPSQQLQKPRWLGEQDIRGSTVLLHWEQGLGDTLMLCRFASDVAAQGARVILSVQRPLVGLLQSLQGVKQVIALGPLGPADAPLLSEPLPEFDFHCPLLSLPLALGVRADAVPHRGGYLRADPQRLRYWTERLGPRQRLRIGVIWSGNAQQLNDHRRSMTLARFMRAMPIDCELVSLQPDLRPCDRDTLASHPRLRHIGHDIRDMADTAALCELVDLVVSTDTSVPHLAGALGRPVWVLQCFSPDWRWGYEGEACAWYDSARMLRQAAPGAWDPLLDQVHDELTTLAKAYAPA